MALAPLVNPKFSAQRMDVTSWGVVPDRGDGGVSDEGFQQTLLIARQDGHRKFRVPAGTYWLSRGLDFDVDDFEFVCPDGVATIYQKTYGTYVGRLMGKRPRVRNLDLRNPVTKTRINNGNIAQRHLGEFRRTEASALVIQGDDPLIENVITRNFIAGLRWIGGKERHYEAALFGASMTASTLQLNEAQRRETGYWVGARFLVRGTLGGSWINLVLVTGYDGLTNTITWTGGEGIPLGTIWLYLVKDPSDGGVVYNHDSYNEDFSRIFQFQKEIEFAGRLFASGVVNSQGAPEHALYGSGSISGIDDSVNVEDDIAPDMPCAEKVVVSGQLRTVKSPGMVYKIRNAGSVIVTNEAVAIGARGCMVVEMCDHFSGAARSLEAKTSSAGNRPSALEMYDVRRAYWKAHMELASDYVWAGTSASIPAIAVAAPLGRGRTPEICDGEISGVFRGTAQTSQYGFLATDNAHAPIGSITIRKMNIRAENPVPITGARIFNAKRAVIGPDLDLANFDPVTRLPIAVQSRLVLEPTVLDGQIGYYSARTGGPIAIVDSSLSNLSAQSSVRDLSFEGSRNLLLNPLFDWLADSFVDIVAANTIYPVATNWKVWRGAAAAKASQRAGSGGTASWLEIQRAAGNASPQSIFLTQELDVALVRQLRGKEVTFEFNGLVGPDWSGSQLRTHLRTGTGVDETLRSGDASVGTYATGHVQSVNVNVTLGTTERTVRVRHTIPADATSAAIVIQYAPSGTAGAADLFRISPAMLIAGASAKPFSALM
ncbi:hypothetical protein [Reyranella sp.]|uniref:hypothetical protein n=1 Tax=Reyranella sp. TaxID=1929291 RepID=UPI003BA9DA2C